MKIQMNKRRVAFIAIIAALIIILAGTFAWFSFNQSRVNVFRESVNTPGVNLHDDFEGGANKDVYVENSGNIGVFVRVRLAEYLETVNRGSLVDGHKRSDDEGEPRLIWSAHDVLGGDANCTIIGDISAKWDSGDSFHDYHKWTMGGQKYYKSAIGLLGSARALSDNPEVCNDTTVYDQADGEYIRQTLPATVVSMADWVQNGRPQGTFWVVDTDGWCYWAQRLEPDQATGLLLDKVEYTGKFFDSDATYCIDVWLQAVDADSIAALLMPYHGGITENGNRLMQLLSGGWLFAADGSMVKDMGDGTFTVEVDKDGSAVQEPRYFVPLGTFADITETISAPEAQRLYIGDKVDIDDLVWYNGDYINYDDWSIDDAPFYNITITENGQYTVIGTEIGADGNVYLRLFDEAAEKSVHLASVLAVRTFVADSQTTYTQGYPGTGPFGFLYAGGAGIGTEEDARYDVNLDQRYFRHIGSGVYVEVTHKKATESIHEPITYYFAGEILADDTHIIDNLDGNHVDAKVAAQFNLQLTVGEGFDLVIDENGRITGITKDDEIYYMKELVEDGTGKLYIDLDNGTYLGPDASGVLGGSGIPMVEGALDGDGKLSGVTVISTPRPAGLGTLASPFKITKRADMDWLTGEVNNHNNSFAGLYLEVGKNFSMGETPFLPIGTLTTQFMGSFDGAEYTISDLVVTASANYGGLFGYISTGGTVENLKLGDVTVDVYGASVGGLAGRNGGTLKNCHVLSGTVVVNGSNVGGLAGYNTGTVSGSVNSGKVSGTGDNVGGVVGYNTGAVQSCINNGEVDGTGVAVGGVVGNNRNGATVENCKNLSGGTVTGKSTHVGGVTGYSYGGTVRGCENNGAVEGVSHVGGVVGYNFAGGTVNSCENSGPVNGSGQNIGGVVGNNTSTVQTSYNRGGVSGVENVGGVVGHNTGTVERCASDTTATGARIYATEFYSYAGGVVGYNTNIIRNCYAWGDVTGEAHRNGGVIGENTTGGSVLNVYHAKGTVSGNGGNGGVIGFQITGATATNCVAFSDAVIGQTNNQNERAVGGQVSAYGTLTNIFYWSDMSVTFRSSTVPQGTGMASRTQAQAWWSGTVGFTIGSDNWRWDATNSLPVLDGVTPQ